MRIHLPEDLSRDEARALIERLVLIAGAPDSRGGQLEPELCIHAGCPARAWSNGACLVHQAELGEAR